MSGNKFECNGGVVAFCAMMETGKNDSTRHRPEVSGWKNGEGYFCKDSKENWHTFKTFVEEGKR